MSVVILSSSHSTVDSNSTLCISWRPSWSKCIIAIDCAMWNARHHHWYEYTYVCTYKVKAFLPGWTLNLHYLWWWFVGLLVGFCVGVTWNEFWGSRAKWTEKLPVINVCFSHSRVCLCRDCRGTNWQWMKSQLEVQQVQYWRLQLLYTPTYSLGNWNRTNL